MPRRPLRTLVPNVTIAVAAVLCAAGARLAPNRPTGPVLTAATGFVRSAPHLTDSVSARPAGFVATEVASALGALSGAVGPLSHPQALPSAVRSYFAYRAAHPDPTAKPYLYFVDYGLPSTQPRGYVFDMETLRVVEGPFTVAHGRGSSDGQYGVPTRFSNANGSAATSLGLYVAEGLYPFHGHAGSGTYNSLGMRLEGVSEGFNDAAFARRVVAHGAPYVTDARAGRSEGCPALEPARAQRLLPKLANGGLVFLFAPDANWMNSDRWLTAPIG